jgi:hypothetical protein
MENCMTKPSNRFARGSGVYQCGVCGRSTRSTGRGDNEHTGLCAQCYDLAGEENHISDYGTLYATPEEVLGLIVFLVSKDADVSSWKELEAFAVKTIKERVPA